MLPCLQSVLFLFGSEISLVSKDCKVSKLIFLLRILYTFQLHKRGKPPIPLQSRTLSSRTLSPRRLHPQLRMEKIVWPKGEGVAVMVPHQDKERRPCGFTHDTIGIFPSVTKKPTSMSCKGSDNSFHLPAIMKSSGF